MTLDESIKHAEEVAVEHTKYNRYGGFESCDECAEEHLQLARWLKELKQLREQTKWTPVSEELPKEPIYKDFVEPSEPVLVQLTSGEMRVSRYWGSRERYKDEPWIDLSYPATLEVVAWMPLPKSYKELGGSENDI